MLLFGALTGVVGAGAAYFFIPGVGQDIKGAVALLAGLGGFILGMACCSIVRARTRPRVGRTASSCSAFSIREKISSPSRNLWRACST